MCTVNIKAQQSREYQQMAAGTGERDDCGDGGRGYCRFGDSPRDDSSCSKP